MVTRLLLALVAVSLCACGAENSTGSGLDLSLVVESVAPADHFAIRVFGGAVKCSAILAEPQSFELGATATCSADEVETSSSCLLAYDVFTASSESNQLSDIPVGSRAVFVEGMSGTSVTARGCAAVTVTQGQAAQVSVTLQ